MHIPEYNSFMKDKKIKSLIIDTIKAYNKKKIRRRELFRMTGIKKLEYNDFKRILTDMEKSGAIIRTKGHRISLPESNNLITGVFTASRKRGGFIRSYNGDVVNVREYNIGGAISGDMVQAKLLRRGQSGFHRMAKIINSFA